MSPKRAPTARPGRDRFTAESYTVLGESSLPHNKHLHHHHHPQTEVMDAQFAETEQLFNAPPPIIQSINLPQSTPRIV